ncbi:MAG: DUF2929 family protein [Bacillota bacterium]|jgi:F0F1-type ATP synthase assembly protein I|uniref:DUF2929 family protein n=2 Tax=Halolactibacillus TaxID=306539 RepID=A0A1I6S4U9_9BACI|nr:MULTISPECIES: DUF2929 family protein [Halolactibacillus]GEM01587.1 hypothetical protein HHA03_11190 [Halolactibacillus halophilus]GEM04924.1 hypothetical protein HMI01_19120 [Halolactibacillus miurensis]SFP36421.1 Protein of unknown function [Halolactibacillus halophilus]SFS71930.1 Protein of unknown function [Halolactibacillus miurensis]
MRVIILMVWSFFISVLLGYVLSSMAGSSFEWWPVLILTAVFTLIGFFIGEKYIED